MATTTTSNVSSQIVCFTSNNSIRYDNNSTFQVASGPIWLTPDIDVSPYHLQTKTKVTFGYTGANTLFQVPQNVNYIFAKVWGAGGAAATAGGWSSGSDGGGGGYSHGVIPVTPGEYLLIVVGGPGIQNGSSPIYGGGGYMGGTDNQYCGTGGGYTGIFRGNTTISQATALMIAGGGGGGGARHSSTGDWKHSGGGAGGGLKGQHGQCDWINANHWRAAGTGANTSYAGTAGVNLSGSQYSGSSGSALQGGNFPTWSYGGGGGGGYFGGGAGSHNSGGSPATMGGGGGGSGFIHSSVMYGYTYAGINRRPANYGDADLGIAFGDWEALRGPQSTYIAKTLSAHGGPYIGKAGAGRCVIYY